MNLNAPTVPVFLVSLILAIDANAFRVVVIASIVLLSGNFAKGV